MTDDYPIPPDEYRTIAKNVPIVSVDLLVFHDGGLLLGKRQNAPAKGEWFVPGGTVLKGETLREAAHRVARQELDVDIIIDDRLGTYEHFYSTAETPGVESKQYLATAFVVTPRDTGFSPDEQHAQLTVASPPFADLHDYVSWYIRDLRASGYTFP